MNISLRRPSIRCYVWLAALVATAPQVGAQMAQAGRLLLHDDFRGTAPYTKQSQVIQDVWKVSSAHAEWKRTAEGMESVWTKGHMPVLKYEGEFGDCVIEVEFKYRSGSGTWAACRVSATNAALNPRAYAASVWANQDFKDRPLGLVLEHDEWKPGTITTVNVTPARFEPNTWYTLRLEIIGRHVLATCNGVTVFGEHEKFGIAKASVYLGVGTCPHVLRNFRVYAATRNPNWKEPAAAPTAGTRTE